MARTDRAAIKRQGSAITSRASRASGLNWGDRYGKNYKKQCAIAHGQHKKLGGICVCCLKEKAVELHHSSYGGNKLYENWHPVCLDCHNGKCHSPSNWKKDNKNPVWGNKNTPEFIKRLRLGYQLLQANEKDAIYNRR